MEEAIRALDPQGLSLWDTLSVRLQNMIGIAEGSRLHAKCLRQPSTDMSSPVCLSWDAWSRGMSSGLYDGNAEESMFLRRVSMHVIMRIRAIGQPV